MLEIDDKQARSELLEAFEGYERALTQNDIEAANNLICFGRITAP
jgi:hypothetical protein